MLSHLGEMSEGQRGPQEPTMPKDQAYYAAEKKIEEALQSGATEPIIGHPYICSLSIETKGGKHGA
jgi:hypothetical protein